MKVSAGGRAKIRIREGEVLHAYRDSVGVWTIGVGHTGRMSGYPVVAGMVITKAMSDAFLIGDLAPVEAALTKALNVPVTINEFDAMASLYFNVGVGLVRNSSIVAALNRGDLAGAAAGFDRYHRPASIIGRRNGEKAQFQTKDVSAATVFNDRADALATRADKAATRGKQALGGAVAGALVAGGSALAGGAHPKAAVLAGGWSLAAALGAAILAYVRGGEAKALQANADAHDALVAAIPKTPGGPSPAAAAVEAADSKGDRMFNLGPIIGTIIGGVQTSHSALSTVISVGQQLPAIVAGIENIVEVGKPLANALGEIIDDARNGRWKEEPADIEALCKLIDAEWAKTPPALTHESVAAANVKAATLPSPSGIGAVLDVLGLGKALGGAAA